MKKSTDSTVSGCTTPSMPKLMFMWIVDCTTENLCLFCFSIFNEADCRVGLGHSITY